MEKSGGLGNFPLEKWGLGNFPWKKWGLGMVLRWSFGWLDFPKKYDV